jgi:hypothetical protein
MDTRKREGRNVPSSSSPGLKAGTPGRRSLSVVPSAVSRAHLGAQILANPMAGTRSFSSPKSGHTQNCSGHWPVLLLT